MRHIEETYNRLRDDPKGIFLNSSMTTDGRRDLCYQWLISGQARCDLFTAINPSFLIERSPRHLVPGDGRQEGAVRGRGAGSGPVHQGMDHCRRHCAEAGQGAVCT